MQKTTYANGDFIEYTYDNCDNVIKLVGENGVIAELVYNKKGLVSKTIDVRNSQTTYYYYDFNGSVTGEYRQSESGALSYFKSYDNDGNQVEKTSINGQVKTITTGTDSDGNTFVSNDGITVDSTTDDFGRTTEVKTSRGEGNSVFFTDYEYANVGTTNATTNLVSKLTQKYGNNEIVNYEYFYDGNGNISSIKQNGTEIAIYSYDELNQLTWSADRNTGLYTQINYDNAGNITSVKEYNLSTTSWSPNGLISEKTYVYGDSDWKDKLTSYNGTTIDYDANGNPLNYRDGMIFDWITGRSLSKITKGNTELEMMYDCNGMRTQKEIGDDVTKYYYDSSNNLIGLTNGNNTLFFYYDSCGMPTSFAHNGTMYYYVKNLQGDIVQITKQDGTVVAKYVYDVWGKILSIKDGSNNAIETTNATHLANLNPFRYRGYVYDNETGLYYLQSRYYDPITGRFLNADVYCDTQTGTPLSTNMFAYCENDAINYCDNTGTVREKLTKTIDVPKISSKDKVYVIYYSYKGGSGDFKTQAYNCYNYDAKSKNTTIKGVKTVNDFKKAWNNMPNGIKYVFIMLHGESGKLWLCGNSFSNVASLKKKTIKCKLWLFSCCGGSGDNKSLAAKFANLCKDTLVYEMTDKLSYSWSGTGYFARPSWGYNGVWKWFRYRYNRSKGKFVFESGYLYK